MKSFPVRDALAKLPPGPYQVVWPNEQGGLFTLWGHQGTPPDFADGWAIPLVARGIDTAMFALCEILNALADRPSDDEWDPRVQGEPGMGRITNNERRACRQAKARSDAG